MTGNPRQTELLFEQALELPADQRSAFLHKACGTDTKLLARVQDLLSLVENEANDDNAERKFLDEEGVGHRIDRYDLKSVLGEGGFGVVYLAEQTEPVTRRVALKIIKLGMDTRAVLRRFEAERQTLAMLDHSDIARLLDGGQTKSGRPYFVMEYVDGRSITEYCDSEKLGITRRLELFKHACEAVQHAHTKGVIHRDIKPSNILVATIDGKAIVKVIDFGISKLLDTRGDAKLLVTESGQFIGTPDYMSPEQASGSADIDTRSDVYSLGMVLYELLSGTLPFDPDELRRKSYREIQHIVTEVDPPAPSTRLLTIETKDVERFGRIAALRLERPNELLSKLKSELEWIPLKAMRKEPHNRYRSATDLAEDIQNYLDGKPLVAAPESKAYRARKYIKRNRGTVVSVTVVFVVILAGFATTLWQWRIALANERRAIVVKNFITQIFEHSNPMLGGNKDFTVKQAMDQAIEKLNNGILEDQPQVQAEMQLLISRILKDNEENVGAIELAERALATMEVLQGPNQPDVARSLRLLAQAYYSQARYEEAEPLYKRALTIWQVSLGSEHPEASMCLNDLAALYCKQGKFEQSEQLLNQCLAICEKKLGPNHPDVATSLTNLANNYLSQGKYSRVEPLAKRALVIWEKSRGPEHPDVARGLNNLAQSYIKQDQYENAKPLIERALWIREKSLGPDHSDVASALNTLGDVYMHLGLISQTEPLYNRALLIREKAFGLNHPDVADSLNNLAVLYCTEDKYAEAEPLMTRAIAISEKSLGSNHPDTGFYLNSLADLYKKQSQFVQALSLYKRVLVIREKSFGPDHPDVDQTLNNLAWICYKQRQYSLAVPYLIQALAIREKTLGKDNLGVATILNNLASLYFQQGQYAQAEPLCKRALMIRENALEPDHRDLVESKENIIKLYDLWNKAEPGKDYLKKAAEWRSKLSRSIDHKDTQQGTTRLPDGLAR